MCVCVLITLPSLCVGAGGYQCVCCYHFAISMCRRWRVPVCVCVLITLPSLCVGAGGYQCVCVVITLPSLCVGAGGYQCVYRTGAGGGREEDLDVPQTDCRQTEHVTCDGQLHSSTVTGDHCQVRHWGGGRGRGERVEGREWKGEGREWKGEGREWKGESTFLRQTVDRLSTLHVMDNSTAQQLLEITVRLDTGGGGEGEGREWRGESGRESLRSSDRRSTD